MSLVKKISLRFISKYAIIVCLILELLLERHHIVCVLFPVLVDIFNNCTKSCLQHLTSTDFIAACMTARLRRFAVYLLHMGERQKLLETASFLAQYNFMSENITIMIMSASW